MSGEGPLLAQVRRDAEVMALQSHDEPVAERAAAERAARVEERELAEFLAALVEAGWECQAPQCGLGFVRGRVWTFGGWSFVEGGERFDMLRRLYEA